MKKDCKKGNHDLIKILSNKHSWDCSEKVVRWCKYCGCIRIDEDYDGRIKKGKIMKMKIPQILIDEKL